MGRDRDGREGEKERESNRQGQAEKGDTGMMAEGGREERETGKERKKEREKDREKQSENISGCESKVPGEMFIEKRVLKSYETVSIKAIFSLHIVAFKIFRILSFRFSWGICIFA